MTAAKVSTCPAIPELGALFYDMEDDMVSAKLVLKHVRWVVASSDMEAAMQLLNGVIASIGYDFPLIENEQWVQLKAESIMHTARSCMPASAPLTSSTSSPTGRQSFGGSARDLVGESESIGLADAAERRSVSKTSSTTTSSSRRLGTQRFASAPCAGRSKQHQASGCDLQDEINACLADRQLSKCTSVSAASTCSETPRRLDSRPWTPDADARAGRVTLDNLERITSEADRSMTKRASSVSTSSTSSGTGSSSQQSEMWADAPVRQKASRARSVTSWIKAVCKGSGSNTPKDPAPRATNAAVARRPAGGDVRDYYDYWVRSMDVKSLKKTSRSPLAKFTKDAQGRCDDDFDSILK
eukprot:TRINITY_DN14990_c0_g5_i2.p1 TRINITY_DN14990_c0_g5~~TRINITY_DN14990_c0_g5_i2.p1  ORF type:complete len:356 (-),score=50.21 TRINITY_DN14990_c0_g5_i2:420-1487(-)